MPHCEQLKITCWYKRIVLFSPFAPKRTWWYTGHYTFLNKSSNIFPQVQRVIGLRSKPSSHPLGRRFDFSTEYVLCACTCDLAMIAGLWVCASVWVLKKKLLTSDFVQIFFLNRRTEACFFSSSSLTTSFFQVPVSCPSHLPYLVPRYCLVLTFFFVFEIDSVAVAVSPFGWRLLQAMPSVNKAMLLSWQ